MNVTPDRDGPGNHDCTGTAHTAAILPIARETRTIVFGPSPVRQPAARARTPSLPRACRLRRRGRANPVVDQLLALHEARAAGGVASPSTFEGFMHARVLVEGLRRRGPW